MKPTFKLIGSSNSIERLHELTRSKVFYHSQISFIHVAEGLWDVRNAKGLINGLRVVQRRGRYRLEREVFK